MQIYIIIMEDKYDFFIRNGLILDRLTGPKISYKISETNSSFHGRYRTTGKVLLLFFWTILLALAKFSLWRGE